MFLQKQLERKIDQFNESQQKKRVLIGF